MLKRTWQTGGERGIRTPGTILLVQRFSKPPLSATQPSLRPPRTIFYRCKAALGQGRVFPNPVQKKNSLAGTFVIHYWDRMFALGAKLYRPASRCVISF